MKERPCAGSSNSSSRNLAYRMNCVTLSARLTSTGQLSGRAHHQHKVTRRLRHIARVAYTRVDEVVDEPSSHQVDSVVSVSEPAVLQGFTPSPAPEALEELLRREYQRGYSEGHAAAAAVTPKREVVQDSMLRTTVKSLTWRVLSTGTTICLALALFHEANAALELGAVEFVSKYALFFVHERMWAAITFLI